MRMLTLALVLTTSFSFSAFAQIHEARINRQLERINLLVSEGAVQSLSHQEQIDLSVKLREVLETLRDSAGGEDTVPTPYPHKIPFTKGMSVFHGNTIRTIMAVGSGDSVVLQGTYSYNQVTVSKSSITPLVNSHGGYSINDVVFYNDTIREVQHLDNTGRIVLKGTYSYNQAFTTSNNVSLSVKSFRNLKVGDQVLYNGIIREIQYLSQTGRAVLKGTYSYNQTFTTVKNLEKVLM